MPYELTYFSGPPTQVTGGVAWASDDWAALEPYLKAHATDAPTKDASGYWTACGLDGGRRRDGAARPTRVIALDWDADDSEPDWGALDSASAGPYVAHTTANHRRVGPANPTGAPRWRVWMALTEAADAVTVRAARSPWSGGVLRGISQPAYVPTTGARTEWRSGGSGEGVRLADWVPAPVAALAVMTTPSPAPTGAQPPWDRDSVRAMLARGQNTNHKAGGIGRCLYRFGFTPEYARAYVVGLLVELRHPSPRRHGDSAAAACGPLSTAWGIPRLLDEGVVFAQPPATEIERAAPLSLRSNPDDHTRPWWVCRGGLWTPGAEAHAAQAVGDDRTLGPLLWAMTTPARVRARNALLTDHAANNPADASQFDQEPYLLTTPGLTAEGAAVVDMTTGRTRRLEPDDWCSRTAGAYATAPRAGVDRLMLDWAGGSEALAEYLWGVCGYAATGEAREKTLWVFYGEPDTGKTTFVEHIAATLGSYAVHVPVETWLAGARKNEVDESLGRVGSARLVISPELPQGQAFHVSRVTAFTGSDVLTSAGKWKSEREFRPKAKLWIGGNHPPATSGYSEAFASRLRVVPFTHKFPRDPGFGRTLETLRGETLGRIITEAGHYSRRGMRPAPPEVIKASQSATNESDILGQWLASITIPSERTPGRKLFEAWRRRPESNRFLDTEASFGRAMRRFIQQYPKVDTKTGVVYHNLRP